MFLCQLSCLKILFSVQAGSQAKSQRYNVLKQGSEETGFRNPVYTLCSDTTALSFSYSNLFTYSSTNLTWTSLTQSKGAWTFRESKDWQLTQFKNWHHGILGFDSLWYLMIDAVRSPKQRLCFEPSPISGVRDFQRQSFQVNSYLYI